MEKVGDVRSTCVCVCARGIDEEEGKRWLLLPRQPSRSTLLFNPLSSALPFHRLSCSVAVSSHLLMSYRSIGLWLDLRTSPPSILPPLHLSLPAAVYSGATQSHLHFDTSHIHESMTSR